MPVCVFKSCLGPSVTITIFYKAALIDFLGHSEAVEQAVNTTVTYYYLMDDTAIVDHLPIQPTLSNIKI